MLDGGSRCPLPKRGQTPQIFGTCLLCQTSGWMKLILGMVVGLSSGEFVLDGDPASPSPKGEQSPLQIFGPCLLRPNGWMDEAGTWHRGRPQPRRLCVGWGPSPLPPKGGGASPPSQFSAHFYRGQTAACIKMPLGIELGLGSGDFVLDGDPAPPPQKGHRPQFSAHICCGQMAAWIKMSLGMELGLDPGDFVLDGDPVAPSPKGGGPPKFSVHVYCDQTAGWMKLILGMVVGLSPGEFVLKGAEHPPQF